MSNLENNFAYAVAGIFLIVPFFMGLLIYIWDKTNIVFSFFMLLLEIAIIVGKFTHVDNKHMHILVVLIGFFISIAEAAIFSSKYDVKNGIVSFFIYQWVWLSLYGVGLHLSSKNTDLSDIMNTLVIAFGSMAAISWFWFGYIF